MPGRFDLRPLASGLGHGLRRRRVLGTEPADRRARGVLIVVPIVVFIAALALGLELVKADQLLAGTALLVGGLLTTFSQVATWRERLLARERKVEAIHIRALNEAAAHILVSVLFAGFTAALLIVLANIDTNMALAHPALRWLVRILSALSVACFSYMALTLIIVVNLLWDAFSGAGSQVPATTKTSELSSPRKTA